MAAPSRAGDHRRWAASAVLLLAGCGAPPDPLDPEAIALELESRASTPATIERALELAELGPLRILRPDPALATDPARPEFWRTCAWVHGPLVREARDELRIAEAAYGASGWPEPTRVEVMNPDLENPGTETEVRVMFDLLGLLGIGRTAAAEALAGAAQRAALGRLERSLWRAAFAVERARVELAAARLRQRRLEQLRDEAARGRRRAALLAERGWIPTAMATGAEATVHELEQAIALAAADGAERRAELARNAGLAPQAPALAAVDGTALDELPAVPAGPRPPAGELMRAHPELRARLLEHAVAEAEVRDAAARAWPGLMIGPDLRLFSSRTLYGGIAELTLPWPGAVAAEVEVALARRTRTRHAAEDALLEQWTKIDAATERAARSAEVLGAHLQQRIGAAEHGWRSARARFDLEPLDAGEWSLALAAMLRAIDVETAARRDAALAALALRETRGPEATE